MYVYYIMKGVFLLPVPDSYIELDCMLGALYDSVSGYDFYKYVFPNNENVGELCTDYSKPNAIYLYEDERDSGTKRRLRRRIMFNDTWEQDYIEYVESNPLTLCSGLSYRNRANRLQNAQRMNALVFDLDGVGESEMRNLFLRFDKPAEKIRTLPMPTFIVISGTGLHLHYVFEEPIDLYPNIKIQLKALKYDLTFRMWEYKATSTKKEIQYQSINQGFRMVGSINGKYGTVLKAFHVGDKVTLDYLNQYAKPENRVDVNRPFKPSKITRAEAKEAYPEWYQRVVVEKKRRLKKWDIAGQKGHNGDELYNWWVRHVGEIKGGHRYYFLMCLAIYACKCDIPKERLEEDMQTVFEELRQIEHDNPLTENDIESALEAYDKEYYNFTIADIEKLTDIRIERNKRNGRKQADHVKVMNAMKALKKQLGEEVKEGRPSAEQTVTEYLLQNPTAKKAEVIRGTGLSKPTVYKYYEAVKEKIKAVAELTAGSNRQLEAVAMKKPKPIQHLGRTEKEK